MNALVYLATKRRCASSNQLVILTRMNVRGRRPALVIFEESTLKNVSAE
jgi:hypothetical protein